MALAFDVMDIGYAPENWMNTGRMTHPGGDDVTIVDLHPDAFRMIVPYILFPAHSLSIHSNLGFTEDDGRFTFYFVKTGRMRRKARLLRANLMYRYLQGEFGPWERAVICFDDVLDAWIGIVRNHRLHRSIAVMAYYVIKEVEFWDEVTGDERGLYDFV